MIGQTERRCGVLARSDERKCDGDDMIARGECVNKGSTNMQVRVGNNMWPRAHWILGRRRRKSADADGRSWRVTAEKRWEHMVHLPLQ